MLKTQPLPFAVVLPPPSSSPAPTWRLLNCDWEQVMARDPDFRSQCLAWTASLNEQPHSLESAAMAMASNLWFCAQRAGVALCRAHPPRHRARWWTARCDDLWRVRQNLWRLWRCSGTDADRESLRRVRNDFAHEVRRGRREGWMAFLQDFAAGRRAEFCFRQVRRNLGAHTLPPSLHGIWRGQAL